MIGIADIFTKSDIAKSILESQRRAAQSPQGYAREAHIAHLVCTSLESRNHGPILEADYPLTYGRTTEVGSKQIRPRVDLWCPHAGGEEERSIFVEVKLAYVDPNVSRIGREGQAKIRTMWMDDIYHLMTCAPRAHCAFVIAAWGWNMDLKVRASMPTPRKEVSSDIVYEALERLPIEQNGWKAIGAFTAKCEEIFGACVSVLEPHEDSEGYQHTLIVIEWLQEGHARSAYVTEGET